MADGVASAPAEKEKPKRNPRKWGDDEVEALLKAIKSFADEGLDSVNWADVATLVPGRSSKQCREKYKNDLRPDISKLPWTAREEFILCRVHSMCGNQWSLISTYLPGRSENNIKNHWNATLRSKQDAKTKTFLGVYCRLLLQQEGNPSYQTFMNTLEAYKDSDAVIKLESFMVGDEYFESAGRLPDDHGVRKVPPIHSPGKATRKRSRQPGNQRRASSRKKPDLLSDDYGSETTTEEDVPCSPAATRSTRGKSQQMVVHTAQPVVVPAVCTEPILAVHPCEPPPSVPRPAAGSQPARTSSGAVGIPEPATCPRPCAPQPLCNLAPQPDWCDAALEPLLPPLHSAGQPSQHRCTSVGSMEALLLQVPPIRTSPAPRSIRPALMPPVLVQHSMLPPTHSLPAPSMPPGPLQFPRMTSCPPMFGPPQQQLLHGSTMPLGYVDPMHLPAHGPAPHMLRALSQPPMPSLHTYRGMSTSGTMFRPSAASLAGVPREGYWDPACAGALGLNSPFRCHQDWAQEELALLQALELPGTVLDLAPAPAPPPCVLSTGAKGCEAALLLGDGVGDSPMADLLGLLGESDDSVSEFTVEESLAKYVI